jgi:hypothetical protein
LLRCPAVAHGSGVAQLDRYALPTDDRGFVQAEALAPDDLAAEIDSGITDLFDLDELDRLKATEAQEREELIATVEGLT